MGKAFNFITDKKAYSSQVNFTDAECAAYAQEYADLQSATHLTKIRELETEAMERRADLQDLENENKDLFNKNESQAMRIVMYKSVDDEIEKYTEDIESLHKERLYMNSTLDELRQGLIDASSSLLSMKNERDEALRVNKELEAEIERLKQGVKTFVEILETEKHPNNINNPQASYETYDIAKEE